MRICIIIPVKRLSKSKSRLADLLDLKAREMLSLYLLEDLLSIIDNDRFDTIVVGSDDEVNEIAKRFGAEFISDYSKGVNEAIALTNDLCKGYDASLIIPIDLPLLEPIDLIMLNDIAKRKKRCIIITPSNRLDGTNILLRKPALAIDTYYDMDSYLLHLKKGLEQGLEVIILLNNRMMHDLDSIVDLNYILDSNSNKKSISYIKQVCSRV